MKKRAGCFAVLLALALLAGCRPPGARALLAGKRLLEQGKPEAAVARLETATALLRTNALAWSYLGLAYHEAGRLANAIAADQQALKLDRDSATVHFNLGCALLDWNRPDLAESELRTYTMLQGKSLHGWLKLGAAQLRLRETVPAERSFSEALRLSTNDPAALNGLGLAQLQRNRPREAAQYFSIAANQSPAYPPALRNLAVVAQQYLNERSQAVERYREYAALKPRPADAEAALAIAAQLQQDLTAMHTRPQATNGVAPANAMTNPPKPPATNATATVASRPAPVLPEPPAVQARPPVTTPPLAAGPPPKTNIEVVRVPDQPEIRVAQDTPPSAATVRTPTPAAITNATPAAAPPATATEKRGILARLNPANLFRSQPKARLTPTPLPPRKTETQGGPGAASRPVPDAAVPPPASTPAVSPAPASPAGAPETAKVPRYGYRAPAPPAAGNRAEAERAFVQGVQAQHSARLNEAIQSYLQAIQADPAFFDAYYNLGLAAHDSQRYPQSLAAYETALAIAPASIPARYNFALTLRDAGYWVDAADELEKLLAGAPNETRAHLVLANLYAQRLHQPQRARLHYLRVLELEPQNPQGTSIRYWLASNPG